MGSLVGEDLIDEDYDIDECNDEIAEMFGVFDFRAFLNLAMLISESERARALRQMMLDVVIDLINRKTGGGTKYINQRDKDFVFAQIQEDNYRRQFTDALKKYVVDNRYKYAHFTDLIYVSIFREKAAEYKKILDLKANDKVRDTFYSEILDIIAAYESGLEQAKDIHAKTIQYSGGGALGHFDLGQLESVLMNIQDDDYYPAFVDKITHLFYCTCEFHRFQEGKRSIGQMIIKSKYQAKLKTKELDIFLFQIFLLI